MSDLIEENSRLRAQLAHMRSWLQVVNNRVQQIQPMALKNAKRLYVGGIPLDSTEAELRGYLEEVISKARIPVAPGNAVISFKITQDKGFAFIEFRSAEEATNALCLDGLSYKDATLKLKRPSNYDPEIGMLLGPTVPDPTLDLCNIPLSRAPQAESGIKLFVGGLPSDWEEAQLSKLMQSFGALHSFNLIKDKDKVSGKSKGYGFCQYLDESATESAIQALNQSIVGSRGYGFCQNHDDSATESAIQALNQSIVGSRTLTVKRAVEGESRGGGAKPPPAPPGFGAVEGSLAALLGASAPASAYGLSANALPGARQQQGQGAATAYRLLMQMPCLVPGNIRGRGQPLRMGSTQMPCLVPGNNRGMGQPLRMGSTQMPCLVPGSNRGMGQPLRMGSTQMPCLVPGNNRGMGQPLRMGSTQMPCLVPGSNRGMGQPLRMGSTQMPCLVYGSNRGMGQPLRMGSTQMPCLVPGSNRGMGQPLRMGSTQMPCLVPGNNRGMGQPLRMGSTQMPCLVPGSNRGMGQPLRMGSTQMPCLVPGSNRGMGQPLRMGSTQMPCLVPGSNRGMGQPLRMGSTQMPCLVPGSNRGMGQPLRMGSTQMPCLVPGSNRDRVLSGTPRTLVKVRSHAVIHGNEEADKLAKKAAHFPRNTSVTDNTLAHTGGSTTSTHIAARKDTHNDRGSCVGHSHAAAAANQMQAPMLGSSNHSQADDPPCKSSAPALDYVARMKAARADP
eukprot:gene31080-6206_t